MKNKKIAIIGAGDIVKKRLKPAFEQMGYEVFLYVNIMEEGTIYIDSEDKWLETLKDIDLIWIATPSFAHIGYLKKLVNLEKFIVLEKPITCYKEELKEFEEILKKNDRNKIFCTSYYLLEKALPLYYLKNNSIAYEKYLDFYENNIKIEKINVEKINNDLGKLLDVDIKIIEGEDKRTWPYSMKYGGHLLETFLHNILMATQFVGNPDKWINTVLSYEDFIKTENGISPCSISLRAKNDNININLIMKKNQEKDFIERNAKLEYENGTVYINLETQELTIKTGKKIFKVISKDYYKNIKYSCQIDLALRCMNKEINTSQVDSLVNQVELINWLLDLI